MASKFFLLYNDCRMAKNIAVGIDVGTYQIKIVVVENARENGKDNFKIIGTGFAESKGLRHGYIINAGDTTKSLRLAIAEAEKSKDKVKIDAAKEKLKQDIEKEKNNKS